MFAFPILYPLLSTVSYAPTPHTPETCPNVGSETAVTIMGFVIGILLIVVTALTTALVFVAHKFILPLKKSRDTNAQGMRWHRHSM